MISRVDLFFILILAESILLKPFKSNRDTLIIKKLSKIRMIAPPFRQPGVSSPSFMEAVRDYIKSKP